MTARNKVPEWLRKYVGVKVIHTPAANIPFLDERTIEAAQRAARNMSRAVYESQGYAENVLDYDIARAGVSPEDLCDAEETVIESNVGSALIGMFQEIYRDATFCI